jgi:hypothetical protein
VLNNIGLDYVLAEEIDGGGGGDDGVKEMGGGFERRGVT